MMVQHVLLGRRLLPPPPLPTTKALCQPPPPWGPLGEAQRRAAVVASLPPTLRERLVLLKNGILPTVLLTAKAYHPSEVTMPARQLWVWIGWG